MRLLSLVLALVGLASATDPTFVLETQSLTPYTPAYLGNGNMGLSTSQLGTLPAQCYVAGVFDHAPGDVPRIALVPAWNAVDVFNGNRWLRDTSPNLQTLQSYRQSLDMYDGVLRTEYDWSDSGPVIAIRTETFVSRADPGLGAVKLELTPRSDGPIRVLLPLRAWPAPKRYPLAKLEKLPPEAARSQQAIWYPGRMISREVRAEAQGREGLVTMLSQAEGMPTTVAEAAASAWPAGVRISTRQAVNEPAIELSFTGQAGQAYTFYKFAAVVPSFKGDTNIEPAAAKARLALVRGYDEVFQDHTRAWHDVWQSDIVVEGNPALQTVVHSMLFYLLGSAREDLQVSIPPMGLSTAGYYGHYFWDADTFMFPPLMLLHPAMAKPIVAFRSRTLGAARANAARNRYRGAMYPWEAGPDGAESTPRFAYQNALYENHVNGDVALAQWQWYLATGDREWLAQYGFPIIRDTADFWTTRVSYNKQKDRYEIGKVVSVIESEIGINNDPYTNATAKKNLDLATLAAKTLGRTANPKWAEVSAKLYLPRTDLLLSDYPLEFPLSDAARREIIKDGSARAAWGAMMGSEFYPIVAAELHDRSAIDALLPKTFRPYIRPPFQVLPETPANSNINFITGAGAFLQQFLFGYSGLRLTEQGLAPRYTPVLPGGVTRLVLRGVTVRGARRDIVVENGQLR